MLGYFWQPRNRDTVTLTTAVISFFSSLSGGQYIFVARLLSALSIVADVEEDSGKSGDDDRFFGEGAGGGPPFCEGKTGIFFVSCEMGPILVV